MKILWLANVPAPYRVSFFNELGKQCELIVLFEKKTSDERDDSWRNYEFINFKGIFLKGKSINEDTALCPEVVKYIKKDKYDHIIVTNFTDPTGMIAIEYMRVRRIPYWLESDGGFAKEGRGLKERLKSHYIKGAELYLSTGKTHTNYYLHYGAELEKIEVYPFSSIYQKEVVNEPVNDYCCSNLRNKLTIPEKKMILAVGQFISRKGFDILLYACRGLDEDIGVYFVGGTPTNEYIEIVKNNNLKNIHFIGYKSKTEVLEYYKAADVFVLPTREDIWGLVINEAMCCGVPVISTNKCGAALEQIRNGKNGYVIEADNPELLRKAIQDVLTYPEPMRLKQNAIKTAEEYTIEKMVAKHILLF